MAYGSYDAQQRQIAQDAFNRCVNDRLRSYEAATRQADANADRRALERVVLEMLTTASRAHPEFFAVEPSELVGPIADVIASAGRA